MSHRNIEVEEQFRNFYDSKFYNVLSKIENEQDILKIENIDAFISEYESYIEKLSLIKKVKKSNLNVVKCLKIENRERLKQKDLCINHRNDYSYSNIFVYHSQHS